MSCSRGKASPDQHTKLQLFADSAGYCQNPRCNKNLFLTVGETEIHIAEIAHIISVGGTGPRAKAITATEKGHFANLILLCPDCHTKVDKAEEEFPEEMILKWKMDHGVRIGELFQLRKFGNRQEARAAVERIMSENAIIFELYGPLSEERFNPESEVPKIWRARIFSSILPNNRKLLKLIDANYDLLEREESTTVETFRQHVLDFEAKHLEGAEQSGIRYPETMNTLFN